MGQKCGIPVAVLRQATGLAGIAMAVSLSACVELGEPEPIAATSVSHGVETRTQRLARLTDKDAGGNPAFGAAIADEPAAALVARQVLEQGGNAADAATALYFALSVTWPAAAGLGGGGICLARNADERTVESIAFLARSPQNGGAVAVPGNVRGFALLQSRYGNRPWASVVGPAERMAATGFPVSRAAAGQFADAAALIAAAPALQAHFSGEGGALPRELDRVTRGDLATTLAAIRNQGVNGFYAGTTARRLVDEAARVGGALSLADLRDYRPEVAPAQRLPMTAANVAVPAEALGAGLYAGALWRNIEKAGASELAELARRTAASLGATDAPGRDYGSTAFAAIDGRGGAVACAVTMNGAFGAGHVAEGTGIVFSANPQQAASGIASAYLMPVIVTSANGSRVFFSGAGAGAPKGAAAIQHAARAALAGPEAVTSALAASPADARSPAHAIACPDGQPTGACVLATGPRGDGMGVTALGF
ncbi:gamma-glutamyltransferase [uncultured Parvibaculum sp.]|uniref:gamma-glutamyltransferase n=1 Tax=uncultured Parvibaculum sp. TaxID=291828 RepID=UPI0030DD51D6|tara:strand:+ start:127057 stop:128502 length:1446 start_codon:yes stop_codon:yes gene_type:complete